MPRTAPSCTPFRLLAIAALSLLHLRLFLARYFPQPPAPFRDCPDTASDVSALRSAFRKCQGELVHRRVAARSAYNDASAGGGDLDERWLAESAVAAVHHGAGGGGEGGADSVSAEYARRRDAHLTRLQADRLSECAASDAELKQFLRFHPHATCPDDWELAHRLRFTDHCYVIPPRACLSPTPPDPVEPPLHPEALWTPLDGRSVRWERYDCADVACIERKLAAFAAGAAADAAAVEAVARAVNSSLDPFPWERREGESKQDERGRGRSGRAGGENGGVREGDAASGCSRDGWAGGAACFQFTRPSASSASGGSGGGRGRGSGSGSVSGRSGRSSPMTHAASGNTEEASAREMFHIRDLMRLKGGAVRLGLDLGGGTGQFAAQMALHNVTILTVQSNLIGYPDASKLPSGQTVVDTTASSSTTSSSSTGSISGSSSSSSRVAVPFQEALAWRGLVAVDMPLTARLPFFDASLDLLHATGTAGPALLQGVDALPPRDFHLALFDWDRLLRPGGILWLEAIEHSADAMPLYEAALERLAYRVVFVRKLDAVVGGVLHRHVQRLWVFLAMPLDRSFASASQKPVPGSTFSRPQPAMLLQQLSRDPAQREEQLGVLLQDSPAGSTLPAWLLAHTNPAAAVAAGALRARPAADCAYPHAPHSNDNHDAQVLFRPTAIRAPPNSGADEARSDEPALRGDVPALAKKRRFAQVAAEDEEVNSSHRKSPLCSPPRPPSKRPALAEAAAPVASRIPPNEESSRAQGVSPSALQPDATLSLAERLSRYDQLTASLRSSLPHGNLSKWDVAVGRLRERVAQKPEFGSNVNQFLVFLHSQLRGSQQPSARAALHQFAALMRARCQQKQQRAEGGNQSVVGDSGSAGGLGDLHVAAEGLGAVECDRGSVAERKVELQWLLR
ncbi:unnamed protein product [Closterium sp. NIES-64]|nr:unnamed protein product [Closterium sp. NIES-64]